MIFLQICKHLAAYKWKGLKQKNRSQGKYKTVQDKIGDSGTKGLKRYNTKTIMTEKNIKYYSYGEAKTIKQSKKIVKLL